LLGRKNYTREELDHARTEITEQLKAYRKLAKAVANGNGDAAAALESFEPLFFNNMALVLDRYFVHRLRSVTGKDGNPLNEVELLSDSLLNNDGVFRGNNVIKLKSEQTVLKLEPGERIELRAKEFERLADAFFADLEGKFVAS
jgi:hypothetical protein